MKRIKKGHLSFLIHVIRNTEKRDYYQLGVEVAFLLLLPFMAVVFFTRPAWFPGLVLVFQLAMSIRLVNRFVRTIHDEWIHHKHSLLFNKE